MSKLPNAPLIEVIYELRWPTNNPDSISKFELLLGNMYEKLRSDFPISESLKPDPSIPSALFLNQVTHRFRNENKYPLYQLGPGILTVNTVDEFYDWDDFSKVIKSVCNVFLDIYSFNAMDKINLSLKYIDFYKVNPLYENLYQYLSDNFHLNINSTVIPIENSKPRIVNFGTAFETSFGMMNLHINTGSIDLEQNKQEGLVFDNTLLIETTSYDIKTFIEKWIVDAHTYLSDFFKNITKGQMYKSFNDQKNESRFK